MRILQLSPRLPYPLTDGGATGIYKPTEAVSGLGHEITFVTYPDPDPKITKEAIEKISGFCDIHLVSRPLPSTLSVLLRTLLKGAYPIERRMMPEMFRLLERLISENQFDIIHLDAAHMGKYGLWLKERVTIPIVLREHNFETLIYERYVANEKNPLKKIVAGIHGKRLRKEETLFLNSFDAVIPITPEDESLMRQAAPKMKYYRISTGVDTNYFTPTTDPETPNSILWVGGINWLPNRDAIEFFAKEILPIVVKALPEVRFDVIGDNTQNLQHLQNSGVNTIELRGRVEDIRPYVAKAAVMICPLRVGGGMRLKLLDFFSGGKAVVSTHIGAEGNVARDGEHILLRDDPLSFAEAVIMLLKDDAERRRLGANARKLVEEEYSWDRIGRRFIEVYEKVINDHREKARS